MIDQPSPSLQIGEGTHTHNAAAGLMDSRRGLRGDEGEREAVGAGIGQ